MAEVTQLRNLKDADPFADLDELAVDMDTVEIVGEIPTSPDALWGKALSDELDKLEEKDDDDADEERDERDGPGPTVAESGEAPAAAPDATPEPPEPVQPEREFIAAVGGGDDADVARRREQAIAHLSERFPASERLPGAVAEVAPESVPAVVGPDPDGPPPGVRVATYDPETGRPESWFPPGTETPQEAPRRRGRPRKIVEAPEARDERGSPEPLNWDDPDRGQDYYRTGLALEVSRVGAIETRPSVNVTLNITHFHGNAEAVTELVKGLSEALASMLDKSK